MIKERVAAAKHRARYWFELQFGVVRLLNIPTWRNPEDGSKHIDNWTSFCSVHAGPIACFAGPTDNIKEGI